MIYKASQKITLPQVSQIFSHKRTTEAPKQNNNNSNNNSNIYILTVMTIHGCSFCNTLSSISRWKEASFSTTNTNFASDCISNQRQGRATVNKPLTRKFCSMFTRCMYCAVRFNEPLLRRRYLSNISPEMHTECCDKKFQVVLFLLYNLVLAFKPQRVTNSSIESN